MAELNEAEQYLLDAVRQGSADGWSQLVSRYEGRLRAFARSKLGAAADADDLVQEAFIGFLRGLEQFRGEASIETYLFAILRRKIISSFRGRSRHVCSLQDAFPGGDDPGTAGGEQELVAPDPTASWYARRDEAHDRQAAALSAAMREIVDGYKKSLNFRDLQIVEMLVYCQLRNKDVAQISGVSENHVALIKHRCLQRVRQCIGQATGAGDAEAGFDPPDTLLSRIWQEDRLSCLKRSTIGAHLLGTLDEPWESYVQFHLDQLGCAFCQANLEDLKRETDDRGERVLRERILESTVGFLSRP